MFHKVDLLLTLLVLPLLNLSRQIRKVTVKRNLHTMISLVTQKEWPSLTGGNCSIYAIKLKMEVILDRWSLFRGGC